MSQQNDIITIKLGKEMSHGLPKSIGDMTLQELTELQDVTVIKKKNTIKFIRDTEEAAMVLEFVKKPGLSTVTQHRFEKTKDKVILAQTASELYKEGHTQTEIAHILGLHQSQVSKLMRNKFR